VDDPQGNKLDHYLNAIRALGYDVTLAVGGEAGDRGDLMPCPFCGGEAYKYIASIRCRGCDVRFSTSILPEDSDMKAGWNTRTTPHAVAVRVLVEAMQKIDRMKAFPDHKLNTTTLVAARTVAGVALEHPAVVSALSSAEGVKNGE
jgi:hypothetical protein